VIGEHIKNLRLQNDLTQEQLAKKVGVGRATIGGWEGNSFVPRLPEIIKLKKALNCTYDELLEGE